MKTTCMNCLYYHKCLDDSGSNYHIHDYCEQLGRSIGNIFKGPLNSNLEFLSNFTNYFPIYNDLEIGDAYCYLFEPSNPFISDDYFEANKEEDIKILLKCVDELIYNYDENGNSPYTLDFLKSLIDKYGM